MDLDQVLPRIFLGSCPRTPADIDRLRHEFEITAVLNVQTDWDFPYWEIDWDELEGHYQASSIEIRRAPVTDFDRDDLRKKLPTCVAVLDELLQADHTVFVHCSAGMNRSPSTVIAYLHWIEGWDLDEAVAHVTSCRDCDPYVEAIRLATGDREER